MRHLYLSVACALVAVELACLPGCGKVEGSGYFTPSGTGLPTDYFPAPAMSVLMGAAGGPPVPALSQLPSSGCGKPLPAQQVPTEDGSRIGYTEWHVQQTGATLDDDVPADAGDRQFFVRVPADYDPNRPYDVVYIGQGCGAQRSGDKNTYPLFDKNQGGNEEAVYVGVSIPDNMANPGCEDTNTGPNSQEWEAFQLIHSFVESTYCVDNNRIIATGYDGLAGAGLAEMWGCYFAGLPEPPLDTADSGRDKRKFAPWWAVRAHLTVGGSFMPNFPTPCNGPAAGFWIHDELDKSRLIGTDIAGLDIALQANGCSGDYESGPKQPWAPGEQIEGLKGACQEYTGCPHATAKRYPLVFCKTSGQGAADQSPSFIPAVTAFLAAMDAD